MSLANPKTVAARWDRMHEYGQRQESQVVPHGLYLGFAWQARDVSSVHSVPHLHVILLDHHSDVLERRRPLGSSLPPSLLSWPPSSSRLLTTPPPPLFIPSTLSGTEDVGRKMDETPHARLVVQCALVSGYRHLGHY